ncbi:MAG: hypothetical protein LQ348_000715 [Seirophora lacunosa]|nr:MAG: hypothetical protein LQ344_002114 [Seirophora lacunosa]KAI4207028.1 MAG: hypothetical protein LQ348_000715 [Seirophora lacunosa]
MPREVEPSNNERAFILEALRENVRLDGRALDAFRNIELSFGDEYGVADVQLGETRVLARISAAVTAPFPDRKFDGIFTVTTELSPMASPAFEVGRQTETETLLSRLLEVALRRSSALSTESLCLLAGQQVWSLTATCHVLSHCGNLLDACNIAVLAALQHCRIPDVTVKGEDVIVHSIEERNPVPLAMLHHPLCVTMALFQGGEKVIVDATVREQQCSEGEVVVTANKYGEVVQIAKLGGVAADALVLLNCVDLAVAKVKELDTVIAKALEQDARARDVGGLVAELRAENER